MNLDMFCKGMETYIIIEIIHIATCNCFLTTATDYAYGNITFFQFS